MRTGSQAAVLDYTPLRSEPKAGSNLRSKSQSKPRRTEAAGLGGVAAHHEQHTYYNPHHLHTPLPAICPPSTTSAATALCGLTPAAHHAALLHEPPTLLVTTLRKERDSLQMALSSELQHRRQLEVEVDQLRRQVID